MQVFTIGFRYLLFMTILLGGVYPLAVTLMGQVLFSYQADGSLVEVDNKTVGTELLSQEFTQAKYFWPRPSASHHAAHLGSATQRSATSEALKKDVLLRMNIWEENAPADLLYASGSGLDPHLTLTAIHLQKERVMHARGVSEQELQQKINDATEERFLGFMGQPRVNVLKLNISLDKNN